MSEIFDCRDPQARAEHVDAAAEALREGKLAVFPTDTVYGIAADAFTPSAVAALLTAKGRGRDKPPPVLIGDVAVLDALATDVSADARALAEEFWPGPLTLILPAQPSLMLDLGDTRGTIALRVPDNDLALELLRATGPLAVSSANITGQDPAVECADAKAQLGDLVAVYLDGGTTPGQIPSTIVDFTLPSPRIVRSGALSAADLGRIVPALAAPDEANSA